MERQKTLLMELYIANLRKACELIDKVIPLVEDFDGKVYNARFQNKINEALTEGLEPNKAVKMYVEDFDYNHCNIELSFFMFRTVYTEENYHFDGPDIPKHRQVHYLPSGYDKVTICNIWTDYKSWDTSKNTKYYARNDSHFWIDLNYNTRINSSAIVQNMKEQREYLIKEAYKLEQLLKVQDGEEINQIESWNKELEELKKKAERLNNAIPGVVRDIFGIKSWANWR